MRWLLPVLAGCSFGARTSATGGDASNADGTMTFDGVSSDAPRDARPVDARSVDATVAIDFVIEAESFTDVVPTASHAWTMQTAVAGASAAAYVQITPADGAACDPVSQIAAGCATAIDYQVDVPVQAAYYVHARMYAVNSSDDSMWFGLDGTPQAADFSPAHDSQWHWMTSAGTFTLPPGMHTLTLWQREAGARVDVVALTRSMTPPP